MVYANPCVFVEMLWMIVIVNCQLWQVTIENKIKSSLSCFSKMLLQLRIDFISFSYVNATNLYSGIVQIKLENDCKCTYGNGLHYFVSLEGLKFKIQLIVIRVNLFLK